MFCRNCANQIDPNAAVCVKCGVAVGQGTNYCPNCGAQTMPGAVVCTQCGVALAQPIPVGEQKSKMAAGLLGIFLGGLGIHNFYLGNNGKAVAQLLISVLSCGTLAIVSEIWAIVEAVQIFTGTINTDAKGIPLKE